MNHARAFPLLPAYADQELGAFQRWSVSRHVARCPSCLAEIEAIQAMRTALRTNLPAHRAPPSLAARIGASLPREAPPPIAAWRPRLSLAGTGLAGCLAGVGLTLMVMRTTPGPDPLIAEMVGDHVRSMMAEHLTDVATSDRHTVKPWLSARLDLSPVVKDFSAEGYPLVGGRLDYVGGHRAAAIVYKRDQHIINLFVFTGGQTPDAPVASSSQDGFNIVRWRMGGLTYAAVSDVEAVQLLTFARLVEGGQRPEDAVRP